MEPSLSEDAELIETNGVSNVRVEKNTLLSINVLYVCIDESILLSNCPTVSSAAPTGLTETLLEMQYHKKTGTLLPYYTIIINNA